MNTCVCLWQHRVLSASTNRRNVGDVNQTYLHIDLFVSKVNHSKTYNNHRTIRWLMAVILAKIVHQTNNEFANYSKSKNTEILIKNKCIIICQPMKITVNTFTFKRSVFSQKKWQSIAERQLQTVSHVNMIEFHIHRPFSLQ